MKDTMPFKTIQRNYTSLAFLQSSANCTMFALSKLLIFINLVTTMLLIIFCSNL